MRLKKLCFGRFFVRIHFFKIHPYPTYLGRWYIVKATPENKGGERIYGLRIVSML